MLMRKATVKEWMLFMVFWANIKKPPNRNSKILSHWKTGLPGCRSFRTALLPNTTSPLSCHMALYEESLVPSTAERGRNNRVEKESRKSGKEKQ